MAKAENLAEELENKILGVVDVFNWCMIGRVEASLKATGVLQWISRG